MSESRSPAAAVVRHPATEKTWAWLEGAEGQTRPVEQRERIATMLTELDFYLWSLDAEMAREPIEGFAAGIREHTPGVCWRLLEGGYVCIQDRGHDNGIHEEPPAAAAVGQEPSCT